MDDALRLAFLKYLMGGAASVTVFLTNGVKLSGTLSCFDDVSLTLTRDGIIQLVMLQAVATIMPQDSFSLYDLGLQGNEG